MPARHHRISYIDIDTYHSIVTHMCITQKARHDGILILRCRQPPCHSHAGHHQACTRHMSLSDMSHYSIRHVCCHSHAGHQQACTRHIASRYVALFYQTCMLPQPRRPPASLACWRRGRSHTHMHPASKTQQKKNYSTGNRAERRGGGRGCRQRRPPPQGVPHRCVDQERANEKDDRRG